MLFFLFGTFDLVELFVEVEEFFLGELHVHHTAHQGEQTKHRKAAHHAHHIGVELKAHYLLLFAVLALAAQHFACQGSKEQLASDSMNENLLLLMAESQKDKLFADILNSGKEDDDQDLLDKLIEDLLNSNDDGDEEYEEDEEDEE